MVGIFLFLMAWAEVIRGQRGHENAGKDADRRFVHWPDDENGPLSRITLEKMLMVERNHRTADLHTIYARIMFVAAILAACMHWPVGVGALG
jgi:hypothetical protein